MLRFGHESRSLTRMYTGLRIKFAAMINQSRFIALNLAIYIIELIECKNIKQRPALLVLAS